MAPHLPNLFLAVSLPDTIKQSIAGMISGARHRLPFGKWVHQADYHITVKFLGGVALEQLAEPLQQALGPVANRQNPFLLQVGGAGTFGPAERPRIWWLDVEGDRPALAALQKQVERALAELGFAPEGRPYRPHITMARQWTGTEQADPNRLRDLAASLPMDAQQWEVTELVLYRTHAGNKPMYEKVARYPFG